MSVTESSFLSEDLARERARAKAQANARQNGYELNPSPVVQRTPTTTKEERLEGEFRQAYRNRPDAFALECIEWPEGQGPTPYQLSILFQLPLKKRLAVRGLHGIGKTTIAAILILWFSLTRDGEDWKCVTTASAWRQLVKFLFPEVHKWARRLRWEKIGRAPFTQNELLKMNLKLSTGEAFAVASNNHELIEGAHADHILYLFDEAKAIPSEIFDAAEGAFSGSRKSTEALAFAISTPGEPAGRFYDMHQRKAGYEDWSVKHVTLAEAAAAGRVDLDWAAQRKRQWGEKSALYQNRVLGEFCASDEDSVIPLAWIEAANKRWEDWQEIEVHEEELTCVGVDVAYSGEDKTIMAPRFGNVISELRRTEKENTMQTAGRLVGFLQKHGGYGVVDIIGFGAGVYDRAREEGVSVVAFNAGVKVNAKDSSGELGFTDLRSAAWWNLREMLDPESGDDVALPPDDKLTGDLTAPHWRVMSGGRIRVESKTGNKDDPDSGVKKRLGRSTDDGDAVVMAFVPKEWLEQPVDEWIAV